MKTNCLFAARLADLVAGELTAEDQRQTEDHLAGCGECREALVSHQQFISTLRAVPELRASENLVPQVLAAIHRQPELRVLPFRRMALLGAAAAVFLIALSPLVRRGLVPDATDAVVVKVVETGSTSLERALGWLCKNQEDNGSWDAEKWGGNRNFQVALTALPAIAVIGKSPTTGERAAVAARALDWLLKQQAWNGTFGPDGPGLPYNHSIATLALLHAYRLDPRAELKDAVQAATSAMIRAQTPEGGWGWQGSAAPEGLITAWHIESLRLADELGVEKIKPALDRAVTWLAAQPVQPANQAVAGVVASSTGTSEVDLCRAYFLTMSLQRESDEASRMRLATIREGLQQGQVPTGSESGSWAPDGQWGRTGGRIYATALASLSLGEG